MAASSTPKPDIDAILREVARTPAGRTLIDRLAVATQDGATMVPVDSIAPIPVEYVLSNPWHPGRLETALAATTPAPPIDVNAFIFFRESWYVVSEGNHRTESARARNTKTISARIHSRTWCALDQFIIMDGAIWRQDGPTLRFISTESREVLELAQRIGISTR